MYTQLNATLSALAIALKLLSANLDALEKAIPSYEVVIEVPTSTAPTIQELITTKAVEYGVNPQLALDLARIESNFETYAKNPKSTAKGLYQFIDGTWNTYCTGHVFDPEANTTCAMQLLSNGGIGHWKADFNTRRKLQELGYVR